METPAAPTEAAPAKAEKVERKAKKKLTPEELKAKWARRHVDPKLHAKWVAETEVVPADSDKGRMVGYRHFPNGVIEQFVVDRR